MSPILCVIMMLSIVIASANLAGEYYNLIQKSGLFSFVSATHGQTDYYDRVDEHYISISTRENQHKAGTENMCNKLFETCETQSSKAKNNRYDDNIFKKYFEQPSTNTTKDTQTQNGSTEVTLQEGVQSQPLMEEFKTFENPRYGITILYPNNWKIAEANKSSYFQNIFIAPLDDHSDKYHERMVMKVIDVPQNITLYNYTLGILGKLQQNLTGFKILGSGPISLSGNSAYGVNTVLSGNQTINVIDQWTLKDGLVYRIIFYVEEAKMEYYKPIIKRILDSFVIIG